MYGEEEHNEDVVLIAENHGVTEHTDVELQIISQLDPDYVVIEDSRSDQDVEEMMNGFATNRTVFDVEKRFVQQYGESFLDTDPSTFLAGIHERILEEETEDDGDESLEYDDLDAVTGELVPKTVEEFLAIPTYECHPLVSKHLAEYAEERKEEMAESLRYTLDRESEPMRTRIAMKDEFASVQDVFEDVYQSTSSRSSGIARMFVELEELSSQGDLEVVSESNEYMDKRNIPLMRAFVSDKSVREIKKENAANTAGRERCMGETLVSYAEESDTPVVSIIGKYHAREPSELYSVLEAEDVSYKTVWLDDEEPFSKTAEEYLEGMHPGHVLPIEEYSTDRDYSQPVTATKLGEY